MEHTLFVQLSLVLAITTVVSLVCRLLRQPLVMGYIVSGFLAGPAVFDVVHDHLAFESFSQIGIVLLLFVVGLGLNVAVIRQAGKPVLATFGLIAVGVGGLGAAASILLGYRAPEVAVMTIALLFSSTIIVVKSLSDKKEQGRLYGHIALGVLLLEDVVATLALLFVSAGGNTTPAAMALLLAKGAGLAIVLIVAGLLVPRLTRLFAHSQELLYTFALAWAFGVASLFWLAGFSIEMGALFAGVTLAHVPYAAEIGTRLKPLRDFFIVLFFIALGERLELAALSQALAPALIFSAIILLAKPLLTLGALGALGYTRQTGFKAAVHLSQISEFSIVLVMLAASGNLIRPELTTVITLTALITIGLSTYLMKFDDHLYRLLRRWLGLFERGDTKRELRSLQQYPLVLLGYQKGGHEFVRTFRSMHKRYVVVDYDPTVIEVLEHQHIHHLYGDATDVELLEELGVQRSELVISTIADPLANRIILSHLTKHGGAAIFICHAQSYEEAEYLYKKGAAYVILPHFIGSEQINGFIRRHGNNRQAFATYRKHHLTTIGAVALQHGR